MNPSTREHTHVVKRRSRIGGALDGLAVKFLEEEEGYGAPPLFLGCGKNDLREEEESGRETDVRMGKREKERERDGSSDGRTKTATPVFGGGGGGGSEAKWKSFGGLSSSFSSSLFSTTRPTSKKSFNVSWTHKGKGYGGSEAYREGDCICPIPLFTRRKSWTTYSKNGAELDPN